MGNTPDIINGLPEIAEAVCEGAVRPILDAEAPVVGVVDAHPRLVILQVVTTFSVSSSAMQQRTSEKKMKNINMYRVHSNTTA